MTSAPDAPDPSSPTEGHRQAGAVCVIHALVLAGFAIFYGIEIGIGAADDRTSATSSAALIALGAVGLALLAGGWFHGKDWPRTPTLLWNAILVPVIVSLFQSQQVFIALGVAVLAVLGFVTALRVPPRDPIARPER